MEQIYNRIRTITSHLELPHNLITRKICIDDYTKGILELFNKITSIDINLPRDKFEQFIQLKNKIIIVIEDLDINRVIATASLLIDEKFSKAAGHIEDVIVDEKYRNRHIGQHLIRELQSAAKEKDLYKIILNCSEKNQSFYEKLGFIRKEIQMRYDLN
jgi:glucosamine-phosphate N-acetyltransferase